MHVPIPNAPRNRRVSPRYLLVDVDSLQRRQVQPAVGSGQEDSKEPGVGKVPRQSVRQAPAGLNAITLSENPRPKGTGCLDGLGCRDARACTQKSDGSGQARLMSAIPPKAAPKRTSQNRRLVPKPGSCSAANQCAIRRFVLLRLDVG